MHTLATKPLFINLLEKNHKRNEQSKSSLILSWLQYIEIKRNFDLSCLLYFHIPWLLTFRCQYLLSFYWYYKRKIINERLLSFYLYYKRKWETFEFISLLITSIIYYAQISLSSFSFVLLFACPLPSRLFPL